MWLIVVFLREKKKKKKNIYIYIYVHMYISVGATSEPSRKTAHPWQQNHRETWAFVNVKELLCHTSQRPVNSSTTCNWQHWTNALPIEYV